MLAAQPMLPLPRRFSCGSSGVAPAEAPLREKRCGEKQKRVRSRPHQVVRVWAGERFRCLQNKRPFLPEASDERCTTMKAFFSSTKNTPPPPRSPPCTMLNEFRSLSARVVGVYFARTDPLHAFQHCARGGRGGRAFSKLHGQPAGFALSQPQFPFRGQWAFILQAPEEMSVLCQLRTGGSGKEGVVLAEALWQRSCVQALLNTACLLRHVGHSCCKRRTPWENELTKTYGGCICFPKPFRQPF